MSIYHVLLGVPAPPTSEASKDVEVTRLIVTKMSISDDYLAGRISAEVYEPLAKALDSAIDKLVHG